MEHHENDVTIEWLERYLRGECTTGESEAVEHWMRQANLTKDDLAKLVTLPDGVAFLLSLDDAAEWSRLKTQLPRRRQVFLSTRWMRMAAAITAMLVIATFYFAPDFFEPETITVRNKSAVPLELDLPDGTRVALRRGAAITYEETFKNGRHVKLEGEAFFDVVRDEASPFTIGAVGCAVRVLGTSFLIDTDSTGTEVIVTSGRVSVDDGIHNNVVLEKGDRGFDDLNTAPTVTKEGSRNFLSWKTGVLTFNDASLKDVVADLSDHFEVTLSLSSTHSDGVSYTSRFQDASLEEILSEMREVLGISYTVDGNRVEIVY